MVEEAKKKILITGITGMLGRDLLESLKSVYRPYGIDLAASVDVQADFYQYDITDIDKLNTPFAEINPWLLIHAAAFTDVDGCEKEPAKAERINIEGTKNIVKLCKKYNTKLIFISTDYVFDGGKGTAYQEGDAPCPINVYGQTKLDAENFIKANFKEFLIVRTSWLFGRYGKNFVDTIINKARQSKSLQVVNDQRGSPTYTVSLAEGIKNLIENVFIPEGNNENYGIYHISNGENCTWFDFAKSILKLVNINTEVLPVSSAEFNRPAKRPAVSILDNTRYEQITGHRLCSWRDALKQYLI